MQLYIAISVIAIILALCAGFGIQTKDVYSLFGSFQAEKTLKQMAQRKENRLIGALRRTKSMMAATGQSGKFYVLIALSMALFVVGLTAGATLNNYFLSPVLAFGFAAVPFLYIRFQHIKYEKLVVEELETALSTISISYERTENILTAVKENLPNINQPIRNIFEEFVNTVTYVDPSMENAIDAMKYKINHSVFYEWCDALKRCAQNRSLKYTLSPIVNKLTEIKIVTNELKNILYKSVRTYWELLIATVCTLFVGLKIIPDSLHITLPEMLSNILIAVNVLLIVATAIRVTIETNDIKFDI